MTIQINEQLFQETTHSPSLVDLVGYDHAQEIVDFCFIANPYYPTSDMIVRLQESLPSLIKSYPSSNIQVSTRHLAQVIGVDPKHLIIGNGATELITQICESLIETIGIPIPTFGEYVEKLPPEKVQLYALSAEDDYQLDLNRYLKWLQEMQLKAALVINPGNPTGQIFSLAEMNMFLKKASWLDLIIVDESFIDFAGEQIPSLLHSAEVYPNLLIVRSMSKHCGVPGLRLGYCYTDNESLIEKIRPALPTWNVNTLAEFYLSLLPETSREYHISRKRVIDDVAWLQSELKKLPNCTIYPTGGNFVLLRIENGMTARELQLSLLQDHKLYVRDCSNKQGMDHYHIRIASQGRELDEQLVVALQQLLHTPQTQGRGYVRYLAENTRSQTPRILVPTCHYIRKERHIQYVNDIHLNLLLQFEAIPIMVATLDQTEQHLQDFIDLADGLLFIEGEDVHPDRYDAPPEQREWIEEINTTRDKVEIRLLEMALARGLPILAICRGSQLLNVVHGGTLLPDVYKSNPKHIYHIDYDNYNGYRHGLTLEPNTWLSALYEEATIRVNSYHHQAVNQLGDGLEPLAYAEDGVLEAFHDPDKPFVVGLQFHPEPQERTLDYNIV
ncbi:MAG: aminotransferase class I/II-fold pyridoxal phosphate-dependent enzyme [Chloroflexota bacterium]